MRRASRKFTRRKRPAADRFWEKVHEEGDCWVWHGAKTYGYGTFYVLGAYKRAHRWAFEELRAEIPADLVLDHLCRNRACVNPWHLEPVTQKVNHNRGRATEVAKARNAGQTECIAGHPLDEVNTYVQPKTGYRYCRTCQRRRHGEHKARKRSAA